MRQRRFNSSSTGQSDRVSGRRGFESLLSNSVGQRFFQLFHEDFRMKFLMVSVLFACFAADASACGRGLLSGRFRQPAQASRSSCQPGATAQHIPSQAAPAIGRIAAEPVRGLPTSCPNGQCPAR